jgi:hypothetical protein
LGWSNLPGALVLQDEVSLPCLFLPVFFFFSPPSRAVCRYGIFIAQSECDEGIV